MRFAPHLRKMTPHPRPDFFDATRAEVANLDLRRKLDNATGRHLEHVAAMRAELLSFDAERDTARKIKQDAIARPTLDRSDQ